MRNQNDCPSCHSSWVESPRTQEQESQEENSADSMENIGETEYSQSSRKKSKYFRQYKF